MAATAAVLAAAGCSDDDDSSGTKSTAAETAPAVNEKKAAKKGKAVKKGKAFKKPSKEQLEKDRRALAKEKERERKEDAEFDRAFEESKLERIVGRLPVRKPPLYVEQYITSENSNTVHTAVAAKRFFCGRSTGERKAAVRGFYRRANERFRREGVKNFVQVVTPIAATTDRLPALAIGRRGKVSLTKRGRAKGPC